MNTVWLNVYYTHTQLFIGPEVNTFLVVSYSGREEERKGGGHMNFGSPSPVDKPPRVLPPEGIMKRRLCNSLAADNFCHETGVSPQLAELATGTARPWEGGRKES